jgi:hypothetical protein
MPRSKNEVSDKEAVERMNEALKAALKMPPRKHKDEPKRREKPKTK